MQRLSLVVVEADGGIVFTHPGDSVGGDASLPSGNVRDDESPEQAAERLVLEQTGLSVELTERLIEFEQEGTPFGTALMTGFVARVSGGELREGDEGPPTVHAVDDLPTIIPVRVANQRVLAAYLATRREQKEE